MFLIVLLVLCFFLLPIGLKFLIYGSEDHRHTSRTLAGLQMVDTTLISWCGGGGGGLVFFVCFLKFNQNQSIDSRFIHPCPVFCCCCLFHFYLIFFLRLLIELDWFVLCSTSDISIMWWLGYLMQQRHNSTHVKV